MGGHGATCVPQSSSKQACRIRKNDKELGNLSIFMSAVPTLPQGTILVYLFWGSGIPVQHSLHAQEREDGVMAFWDGLSL